MLTQKIEIAPSILTADFGALRSQIIEVTAAGVDRIHLDIMDGHFVPPLSFSTEVVTAVASATNLPIEVHLMVENPLKYIEMFAEAGASTHIFHFEAMQNLDKDRKFLTQGGVFTDDQIDAYIDLKFQEIYKFEHTPHPIEFEMYYSG